VGEYDEKDSAAGRRLKHDIAATERSGRHDHNRAEWQTKQALGRAARDYDRQQRLLKSTTSRCASAPSRSSTARRATRL
jgi:hypothetical protein